MGATLNMLKLCVGAECVEDLVDWQAGRLVPRQTGELRSVAKHVTRMWPTRGEELLAGGSLYWVFKGLVLARQPIVALEPSQGADGIRRCAILLDPNVVRTHPQPRRPFQGWRYLRAEDAPRDLARNAGEPDLPPALAARLYAMGVL
jgi:hypothetical protein